MLSTGKEGLFTSGYLFLISFLVSQNDEGQVGQGNNKA
jgi:hypothetical protein